MRHEGLVLFVVALIVIACSSQPGASPAPSPAASQGGGGQTLPVSPPTGTTNQAGTPAASVQPLQSTTPEPSSQASSPAPSQAPVSAGSGGQVTLQPSTLSLRQGATGAIEVRTNVPAPGLGAWGVDVTYDPAVIKPVSCDTALTGAVAVCNQAFAPGTVRIAGASANGISGSQTIAKLSFEGQAAGSSALKLNISTMANPNGESLSPPGVEESAITVTAG
jgi:hypothetical protein